MVAHVALAWAIAGAPSIAADPDPQSIVGGAPTEPGEFDDVVELTMPSGNTCSGIVVAPRVVLTAAHCVVPLQDGDVVRVGYGAPDAGNPVLESVGFGAHPAYDSDPQHIDIHDYGYVLLGTDFMLADGYVELIDTQAEWDEAMVEGREVTVVGYGEAESGSASAGIKRKVDLTISRFSELGLEFFAGGDQLDSCRGDSGGPAFVRMDDGSLRLAGLVSRGTEVCGTGGWYSAPYPALCWVEAATDAGLTDPACNTCDCVDTTPEPDDDGCSIAPRDDARGWWLALVLLALRPRSRRWLLAFTAIASCTDREHVEPVVCAEQTDRDACILASGDSLTCDWHETQEIVDVATCETMRVGACIELAGPGSALGCTEESVYVEADDGTVRLVGQCGQEPPVDWELCMDDRPAGCGCWDDGIDTE